MKIVDIMLDVCVLKFFIVLVKVELVRFLIIFSFIKVGIEVFKILVIIFFFRIVL